MNNLLRNSLAVIFPYKYEGVWRFDDPNVGLHREPFVSGADVIIDVLADHIPGAQHGFLLVFGPAPFPGYSARLVKSRAEGGGNWYYWPEQDVAGWLCPALFKYFDSAPSDLYVRVAASAPLFW